MYICILNILKTTGGVLIFILYKIKYIQKLVQTIPRIKQKINPFSTLTVSCVETSHFLPLLFSIFLGKFIVITFQIELIFENCSTQKVYSSSTNKFNLKFNLYKVIIISDRHKFQSF